MRKFIFAISILAFSAHGATLHYGQYSTELTATQHTSPSLHVQMNDTIFYGALFDGAAPTGSLRITYNGTNYRLGPWCAAGTYLPDDARECTDCGIGYYCAGGRARTACTGGALACPGKNNIADATADASLMNRLLSLDEVNEHIHTTDATQWELVSCCSTHITTQYGDTIRYDESQIFLPDVGGCPVNVIAPGTYLFITSTYPGSGVCSRGAMYQNMAVISQPSSFKQIHANNYFYIIVDTTSTNFQSKSFQTQVNYYCSAVDEYNANVSNATDLINVNKDNMCVFKLK